MPHPVDFFIYLLHIILPQDFDAGLDRREDAFRIDSLADRHQADFSGVSSDTPGGRFYALFNPPYIFRNG